MSYIPLNNDIHYLPLLTKLSPTIFNRYRFDLFSPDGHATTNTNVIYISLNNYKSVDLIHGQVNPHDLYTYFMGKSSSSKSWNRENWPSDKVVEDRISTDTEVLVKGYQNLLSKDVRG